MRRVLWPLALPGFRDGEGGNTRKAGMCRFGHRHSRLAHRNDPVGARYRLGIQTGRNRCTALHRMNPGPPDLGQQIGAGLRGHCGLGMGHGLAGYGGRNGG